VTAQTPDLTEQKNLVFIVEDDRDLNSLLKFTLESSGECVAESIFDSTGVKERIESHPPSLVILDVMLPGPHNGIELLRIIRSTPEIAATPVILLTAKNQEHDKIEGFESGADDYISKPFSPKELLLRVNALLRRSGRVTLADIPASSSVPGASGSLGFRPSAASVGAAETTEPVVEIGPIRIYTELFKVTVDTEVAALTSTEYQLLLFLAERAGRLQSRSALLQKVWGYEGNVNTRTVDTHIKRLRQKLGVHGPMIETVHGFGYQLTEKPSQSVTEQIEDTP
jgi:two-component system phosphate regulon response regulator PhoB